MGKLRIVQPVVDRIPLSDGDWVEIKRDLNVGDQKLLAQAGVTPMIVGGRVISPIDWGVYEIERAMIFLTDWSFRDLEDRPLKLSADAIRSLDSESFDEINDAIITHVTKRATEKKSQREAKEKEKPEAMPPTAPNSINPASDQTSSS